MSQCEADSMTRCFGCEKGNEDALQVGVGNSFARITNLN
jgi:hypothetical protein